MIRVSPLIPLALVLSVGGCAAPVLDPSSEPTRAAQTRPGAPADDDAPLTPAPSSVIAVGTITEVPARLGTAAFLIEQYPDRPLSPGGGPSDLGDKYHVTITNETQILRRGASGARRSATPDEIAVGMRAEVWFVGPIRESYPMQGTAGRIVIFDP
jgi:hypothetical protein